MHSLFILGLGFKLKKSRLFKTKVILPIGDQYCRRLQEGLGSNKSFKKQRPFTKIDNKFFAVIFIAAINWKVKY